MPEGLALKKQEELPEKIFTLANAKLRTRLQNSENARDKNSQKISLLTVKLEKTPPGTEMHKALKVRIERLKKENRRVLSGIVRQRDQFISAKTRNKETIL